MKKKKNLTPLKCYSPSKEEKCYFIDFRIKECGSQMEKTKLVSRTHMWSNHHGLCQKRTLALWSPSSREQDINTEQDILRNWKALSCEGSTGTTGFWVRTWRARRSRRPKRQIQQCQIQQWEIESYEKHVKNFSCFHLPPRSQKKTAQWIPPQVHTTLIFFEHQNLTDNIDFENRHLITWLKKKGFRLSTLNFEKGFSV